MTKVPLFGDRKYRIVLINKANIDNQDALILNTLCTKSTFVIEKSELW